MNCTQLSRTCFVGAIRICRLLLPFLGATAFAGSLAGPYTDPRHQTTVYFGAFSHYAQPWRGYFQTVPAHVFNHSIGINYFTPASSAQGDVVAHMLAKNGVRRARVEYGWGGINYDDASVLNGAASFRRTLLSLQTWGIRPMILLNCHQGVPCPVKYYDRRAGAAAPTNSTTIELTDVSGLVPGRSGLRDLTDYWAAEVLIVAISNHTCTLSKPLPVAFTNGQTVKMATLKYRPFSAPGSPDYLETVAGWQRYVGTVAKFAAETLGTTYAADKGFDMEIYNELTFGTHFLYINDYYEPDLTNYTGSTIWSNLPRATGDYATTNAALFTGVTFCDGFPNTIPWPAASTEHPRLGALSKHPYPGPKTYPAAQPTGGTHINALFQQENRTNFIPAYTSAYPEYPCSAQQTETQIRDMSPITTDIYNTMHGRYARILNGQVSPVECWMTETGVAPNEWNVTNHDAGLQLKAKAALRLYPLFINKGVTGLFWFNVDGGDQWLGAVLDSFIGYSKTNSVYPADDAPWTSPWLQVMGRLTARMGTNADLTLTNTRPLTVLSISDTHDHFQFAGDGTAAHPNLYNRELLAILPFQANASRFVIPYYVITKDMRASLAPEAYTVILRGLNGSNAVVSAYDPVNDAAVPVTITALDRSRISCALTAADYPYLLIIEEAATPAPPGLRAEPGNARVALSWPAVAAATGYSVYRGATGGGPYQRLAQGVPAPYFVDTNVVNGATNYYVVSAEGPRGESADSPEAAAAPRNRIIRTGALWKYLDNGSDQGTTWRGTNFDDTAWASGPAQLGYGDGDEATVVSYGTDKNARFITTYFRRTFTIENPGIFSNLTVRLLRDDGGIVYLNGTEIFWNNMPAGTVNYRTLASTNVGGSDETTTFYSGSVSVSLLKPGTNVMAVEIHQNDAGSSDISFDLELVGGGAINAPLILAQPQTLTVLAGQSAAFSVTADSAVPDSFQWLHDGQPIPGATNADLLLPDVRAEDAGSYTVVVSNPAGTVTSSSAELEVVAPPVLLSQPQSQGVAGGATVTLSVTVAGTAPFSYQWLSNGWVLPGATAPPLVLSNFQAAFAAGYSVVVSNPAGVVTSSVANLVLSRYATNTTTLLAAGALWKYLDNGTDQGSAWRELLFDDTGWSNGYAQLGYGESDERTRISYGPDANNKYITTWFRRGFLVTDPSAFNQLTIRLLRDDGAVVYLNGTEVWRSNMPEGPISYTTLANSSLGAPEENTFYSTNISSDFLATGTNFIAVEVHQGEVASSDLSFDLELLAHRITELPAVLAQPQSQSRLAGSTASFSVGALGAEPLSYQWRFNGTNLPGATNAVLQLRGITTNQAGPYTVLVRNMAGIALSQTAWLTVVALPRLSAALGSHNELLLSFTLTPPWQYVLEASTNLQTWLPLTNCSGVGGPVIVGDPQWVDLPVRFYRLRVEEP